MKHIWIVMKKELARVFQDKKLIFTMMIMPGLLIFLVYTFMGKAIENLVEPDEFYEIKHINLPASTQQEVIDVLSAVEITVEFKELTLEELDETKKLVSDGEIPLVIIFDSEAKVLKYYYNDKNINSSILFNTVSLIITPLPETTIIDGVEVGIVEEVFFDKASNNMLATMLPMLIIMFLFQGALSVGPESIAGDKERGTIATLLATPTKRKNIAMGKIFSLSILAVLTALSSFIGIMASMPSLMGIDQIEISYGIGTYLYILVVLVTSVILITSIISIISAFARSVKEAASLSAPVMIIGMTVGLIMMFEESIKTNIFLYMIPIYNTALLLKNAFSGNINMLYLVVGSLTNITVSALLVVLLTKMFNSEKRMFTK